MQRLLGLVVALIVASPGSARADFMKGRDVNHQSHGTDWHAPTWFGLVFNMGRGVRVVDGNAVSVGMGKMGVGLPFGLHIHLAFESGHVDNDAPFKRGVQLDRLNVGGAGLGIRRSYGVFSFAGDANYVSRDYETDAMGKGQRISHRGFEVRGQFDVWFTQWTTIGLTAGLGLGDMHDQMLGVQLGVRTAGVDDHRAVYHVKIFDP
jgi:hypothetical protein